MQTSQPERCSSAELELVADFLQNVFDWSELWSGIGLGERLRIEQGITEELDALFAAGLVVYAGTGRQLLESGVGPSMSWNLAVVEIVRSEDGKAEGRLVLTV